jgi:hemolysin activation/secretion protein
LELAATSPEQIEVSQFTITGNTVFDSDFLESVAWGAVLEENPTSISDESDDGPPLADRPAQPEPLSRADLVRASDAITQYYVRQQYINSGAFVPSTDRLDGAVEIRVIEGRLDNINVKVEGPGLFSLGESYVRDRLRVATRGALNLEELVDSVRLLEQDPLIDTITTEIVPGTETGTSTLNVDVKQDDGLDVNLSTANRRSPSIGSFGQQVTFSQANLLGRGDRLSLGYERTEGLDSWDIGYSVPLNARNGVLSFDFNTTDSRIVEDPFDSLDIESSSQTYELSYRQPLTLTPTEEFALTLTGYHRDNEGRFLESIPFPSRGADADGRTRITAVRFGQEWIKRQPKEVFSLFSEFSLGVNALGATISDNQPDSEFFLWRGQGQWVRRLGEDSLFLLRGNVQLADSALVPSEQFGVGGQTTVRGYRPNSILSDNGWLISSEVRLPIMRVPEVDGVLQVAPFLDIGGGWNNGGFADPDPDVLTSTGLGLLWRMGDNFDARLDWGIPLTNDSSLEESGLQFSINFSPF